MGETMRARNNPFSGAGYFLEGLSLMTRKGVKRYVAIPLLINVALFAAAIYIGWGGIEQLRDWVEEWLWDWLDWLSWLLIPLFVIVALLVLFFSFAIVGNLIAAPFNGLLAEAIEKHLTGQPLDSVGGWKKLATDFFASIVSELRKLVYFAVRAVPLLILLLIPGVNVVATAIWLVFSAWMLTVEYADYPMANHGLSFPKQRKILARHRFLSLGFGGLMTFVLMVPFLNFLVIPAGVAGATAMWVEQFSKAASQPEV